MYIYNIYMDLGMRVSSLLFLIKMVLEPNELRLTAFILSS